MKRSTPVGLGFLLIALVIVLYYIWGPSYGYFHSDYTDTILWAKVTVEAGRTFHPDFNYAAMLPFGASLWYVPLVGLFGMTMHVQLIGMTIFLFVLAASLVFLFRSLEWGWGEACGGATVALLLFSGSDKLRELFWGHTIYYSLGVVFMALGLGLILRQRFDGRRRWLALLLLLSAGAATNSTQIMAVYLLPLLGALGLEMFLPQQEETRRKFFWQNLSPLIQLLVGSVVGMAVLIFLRRGGLVAGYAEAYTSWSPSNEWPENAGKILPDYLKLFGVENKAPLHIFTMESILLGFLLLAALLVLVLPLIQLLFYRNIRTAGTRLLLLFHAVQCLTILFLYVFGRLSAAYWRLTPCLTVGVLATLAIGRDYLKFPVVRTRPGQSSRRFGVLIAGCLLAGALANALTIVRMPGDYGQGMQLDLDRKYLLEQDLSYGYAGFWQAPSLTLLTDEQSEVRHVEIDEKGLGFRPYQNMAAWYQPQPGVERYFLLLNAQEYELLQDTAVWQDLLARQTGIEQVGQHWFLLFDRDISDLLRR